MGIVADLEKKMKLSKTVGIMCLVLSVVIVIAGFIFSYLLISDSRKTIYVLDNGVPVLVKQTDYTMNRELEYKSQVDLFHSIFFTIAPDDDYIKAQMKKALYLIDESGNKEYMALKESGFYNQIISSNSIVTVIKDSIKMDYANKAFTFYGREYINRKTQLIERNLITHGKFRDIPRTDNNTHGVLLEDWRIVDNTDIKTLKK
ncbi:conjugative transposon protein TraK [Chryseobacterium antibioticum]|uniref:Conjugative transposon protein TraK n=1 Tax=Chryseobacterium pyrolae TaxID=2987481 RepID=A0ABT2IN32_9FLAO|nr:conjugative transposon protein TraK [Chryseobacterium pyrolae]MCT2409994.1 conjugative transposon protein TraK [Chryseobacterium pyrolae]